MGKAKEEVTTQINKSLENIVWEEKHIVGRNFDTCAFYKCSLKGYIFDDCHFEKCTFEEVTYRWLNLKKRQ